MAGQEFAPPPRRIIPGEELVPQPQQRPPILPNIFGRTIPVPVTRPPTPQERVAERAMTGASQSFEMALSNSPAWRNAELRKALI